ncbi:unnamed protein product [Phytomonas sp. EM1]|nr:unnamed protein product [Phytomonas sp. EM1]|eukprot:CCW64206.1 unnamed protein product [Phytomonas sp. isolate EM1]
MYSFSGAGKPFSFGTVNHQLTQTTTDCVSKVRFSPVGFPAFLLGVTSWDCSCSVWQVQSNQNEIQAVPSFTTTHDAPILDLSFSYDGKAFFGGCSKTATMWNLSTNQKSTVASHDLPISCLAYINHPQVNDLLITGSWDGKLRCWDLRQPNFIMEENLGEPIFALDVQRSKPMMAVATGRMVHIFHTDSMRKEDTLKPPDVVKFNIRCVSCSSDFEGVAAGTSEGRLSFLRMDKKPGCTFKAHIQGADVTQYVMYQTNFCVHHPSSPLVISGGGDGVLAAVNRSTKKLLRSMQPELKIENDPVPISAGDISPDGSLIAYAHSYDWAMGRSGYRNQPTSVHIRKIEGDVK